MQMPVLGCPCLCGHHHDHPYYDYLGGRRHFLQHLGATMSAGEQGIPTPRWLCGLNFGQAVPKDFLGLVVREVAKLEQGTAFCVEVVS